MLSGRGACRGCKSLLDKDELKIGAMVQVRLKGVQVFNVIQAKGILTEVWFLIDFLVPFS